jgi:hypothetical protein
MTQQSTVLSQWLQKSVLQFQQCSEVQTTEEVSSWQFIRTLAWKSPRQAKEVIKGNHGGLYQLQKSMPKKFLVYLKGTLFMRKGRVMILHLLFKVWQGSYVNMGRNGFYTYKKV